MCKLYIYYEGDGSTKRKNMTNILELGLLNAMLNPTYFPAVSNASGELAIMTQMNPQS